MQLHSICCTVLGGLCTVWCTFLLMMVGLCFYPASLHSPIGMILRLPGASVVLSTLWHSSLPHNFYNGFSSCISFVSSPFYPGTLSKPLMCPVVRHLLISVLLLIPVTGTLPFFSPQKYFNGFSSWPSFMSSLFHPHHLSKPAMCHVVHHLSFDNREMNPSVTFVSCERKIPFHPFWVIALV